jgi:very-short-patch-repair endonuclease
MNLGTLGIVRLAELEASGIGRRERNAAIRSGDLERVRNGWFALPGADPDVVRSVRLGGRLTCGRALRIHGLWVGDDAALHVAVNGNAARLRDPDQSRRPWDRKRRVDVRLHWRSTAMRAAAIDDVAAALEQYARCAPFEHVIATLDSALNRSVTSLSTLESLLRPTHDSERILRALDGGAQSGTESLARLRLRSLGLTVRTQVPITGVGHVDLLIGDRLVLEIDSVSHHLGTQYERDRLRDLELVRQGFIVIRASYRTVIYDWNALESAIRQIVNRGDHHRRSLHRRRGLAIALP